MTEDKMECSMRTGARKYIFSSGGRNVADIHQNMCHNCFLLNKMYFMVNVRIQRIQTNICVKIFSEEYVNRGKPNYSSTLIELGPD